MAEIKLYYYLKRMDEELQDELKPKLEDGVDLDGLTQVGETQSSALKIGMIHASQRQNAILKNQITNINFDLIILLIQGAGKPKETNQKYQKEYPKIEMIWECGTEYLIEYFEQVQLYLKETPPQDWHPQGWIAPESHYLAALALLCAGYLTVHSKLNLSQDLPEAMIAEIQKSLTIKQERVSQVSWWLEPLGIWDKTTQKLDGEAWEEFEQKLTQAWYTQANEAIPDALNELLKAIQEDSLKQPQIVADAYSAIAANC
jgi:hypothetical protein